MALFDVEKQQTNAEAKAVALLKFANKTADMVFDAYRHTLENVWNDGNIETIAEVQAVFDAMDSIKPGSAALAFQLHHGLGQFISSISPDKVPVDSIKSPVDYTVDTSGGYPRIVLDASAEYPRIAREKAAQKAAMLAEAERLKAAAE
jgi:hypothetical protein